MPESIVYNMDCLEAMKQMSDNAFDLAVADPPYGINITGRHRERERERPCRWCRQTVRWKWQSRMEQQKATLRIKILSCVR